MELAISQPSFKLAQALRGDDGEIVGHQPIGDEQLAACTPEELGWAIDHLRTFGLLYNDPKYIEAYVRLAYATGRSWSEAKTTLLPKALHAEGWKVWTRLEIADRDADLADEVREMQASGMTWSRARDRWTGDRRTAVKVIWDAVAAEVQA